MNKIYKDLKVSIFLSDSVFLFILREDGQMLIREAVKLSINKRWDENKQENTFTVRQFCCPLQRTQAKRMKVPNVSQENVEKLWYNSLRWFYSNVGRSYIAVNEIENTDLQKENVRQCLQNRINAPLLGFIHFVDIFLPWLS